MRPIPLTALLLLAPFTAVAAEDPAELLSGPYSIHPGKTTMTVCWQTKDNSEGAVKYRLAGAAEWKEARGAKGRFHAVTLTGLESGKDYEARALAGGKELAGLTFRTVPEKLEEFTFYVYGDTRSNPAAHTQVAAALAAEARRLKQPTFVVMIGDLARNGSDEEATADQFFLPAKPLLRMMPLVPLRGNHELGTDLFEKYFPPPPGAGKEASRERVVDYGSVRVITLDQYSWGNNEQERAKWLGDRLAEAKDGWRFVAFHEPLYSTGPHGSNLYWRRLLEPVFVAGRVHAVFAGHDHNYERCKPQNGVTHLTVGAAGAPMRPQAERNAPWSVKFEAVAHFATVTVTPQKLRFKALQPAGDGDKSEVLDEVEIPLDCKWPAPAAPAPVQNQGH